MDRAQDFHKIERILGAYNGEGMSGLVCIWDSDGKSMSYNGDTMSLLESLLTITSDILANACDYADELEDTLGDFMLSLKLASWDRWCEKTRQPRREIPQLRHTLN